MQAPTQPDPALFTQSTRLALRYAAHRAAARAQANALPQKSTKQLAAEQAADTAPDAVPAAVSVPDLLVGMLYAHPSDAEPLLLLHHAGLPAQALLSALDAADAARPPARSQLPELTAPPLLDAEAEQALAEALEMSQRYNPETPPLLRLRDLFAGVLVTKTGYGTLAPLLSQRIDLQRFMKVYPEFLATEPGASFAGFLTSHFGTSAPAVAVGDMVNVAMAIPDSPSGEDFVMIGPEVEAMAYLLSARDLRPPLAIGLFGDWGSGKSFFMEALRARVHAITKAARDSERPQGQVDVFKSIVQIEFNAWHYVEGNLWASLVEHIFRNLQVEAGEKPAMLEQRQKYWLDRLERDRRALAQVDARLSALGTQKAERERNLQDKRAELKQKRETLGGLRVRDFIDSITLSKDDQVTLMEAYRGLGLSAAATTAREALEALHSARAQIQRGNALTAPLRDTATGGRWALALGASVLAGPVLVAGIAALGNVDMSALQQVATSLGGIVAALVVYLRAGTSWMAQTLDRVDRARASLEGRVSVLQAQAAAEVAGLETEIETIATDETELQLQVGELTKAIAAVEIELSTLTPTQVLLDFVRERVGSSDYRKHLGIAALIRRDFEQLTQLIEEQNEKFVKDDRGGPWTEKQRHVLNRIILYIDDLDRCPPGRVVQVLQAIHLLLAFPLFTVVVAVDSRWLSRSLPQPGPDAEPQPRAGACQVSWPISASVGRIEHGARNNRRDIETVQTLLRSATARRSPARSWCSRFAADEGGEGAVTVEGPDDGITFKAGHAGAVLGAGVALGLYHGAGRAHEKGWGTVNGQGKWDARINLGKYLGGTASRCR